MTQNIPLTSPRWKQMVLKESTQKALYEIATLPRDEDVTPFFNAFMQEEVSKYAEAKRIVIKIELDQALMARDNGEKAVRDYFSIN